MKTRQRYLRECARRSVEVVNSVWIVQCHAIIDVVIDVRVVQCHAIIDVVIGVRVMLCHQVIDNSGLSTFSEFSISCPNSHLVVMLYQFIINFPCAIFCTSVTVDRRQL